MVNHMPVLFSALSDPTRFRVVTSLRKGSYSAGELADICSASAAGISRHLRVLRKAGIIEVAPVLNVDDDARFRVYRLRPESFRSIGDWAAQMQAFWNDQLGSFKAHAEKQRSKPS